MTTHPPELETSGLPAPRWRAPGICPPTSIEPSHDRCERIRAWSLPKEPHTERPGLPGEAVLLARRYGLSSLAHGLRAHRRRNLLGPVVPRSSARDGTAGRGTPLLSDRDRHG